MINENEKIGNVERIQRELKYFTCTRRYHRIPYLFKNFLLTDGAVYVAEKCDAYWLFDLIASHQINPRVRNHPELRNSTQFWTLKVKDKKAEAICEWDEGQIVVKESIYYTDFPLPEIKIWVSKTQLGDGQIAFIAYLPSER